MTAMTTAVRVRRTRPGPGRVRPGRADLLPAPVRDHRGRAVHLLLRDPQQRDPRGRALRDRQRREHDHRLPDRPAGARLGRRATPPGNNVVARVRQAAIGVLACDHRRPPIVVRPDNGRGSTRDRRRPPCTYRRPDPARATSRHHRHRGVEPCHQQLDRPPASAARSSSSSRAGSSPCSSIAALAFDVGMMLVERRDEQNAADAAALAGLATCSTIEAAAEAAARDLAADERLRRRGPERGRQRLHPGRSTAGMPGSRASSRSRSSRRGRRSSAASSAAPPGRSAPSPSRPTSQNLTFPFSMLALEPDRRARRSRSRAAASSRPTRTSSRTRTGPDCARATPIGFSRTGGSTINVIAPDATCRVVGELQDQGSVGSMTCTKAENSFALPDPLRNLAGTGQAGAWPPPMVPVGHTDGAARATVPGDRRSKAPTETAAAAVRRRRQPAPVREPGVDPVSRACIRAASTVDQRRDGLPHAGDLLDRRRRARRRRRRLDRHDRDATDATPTPRRPVRHGDDHGGLCGGVMIYNSKLPDVGRRPVRSSTRSGATMKLASLDVADDRPGSRSSTTSSSSRTGR